MQGNLRAHITLLFFIAIGVGGCAQPPTTVCDSPNETCVCEYNGKWYAAGDGFPSADGCNTCGCSEDGSVACTLKACVDLSCGGLKGDACPDGQYCDYPVAAMCGAADATGVCKTPSEVCTDIYKPVCACGDETFGNACEASRAGKSVAYEGECKAQTCGGLRGEQCSDTQFCSFPSSAICGFADATGTCEARPELCPTLVKPVCGCDSKTYNNECEANRAGVSVSAAGKCP